MRKIISILLLMISFLPSRVQGQIDSIINNDFFQGRALFLNGKEVGRSTGYLKGQKTIRDSYFIDQKTIMFLERDSFTKSVKRIEISNVYNDTSVSRAVGWAFQNDTMLRSYFYQLPKWETSDSNISYFYYPNGLLASKSALLKTNENYGTHVFYYPTQEVKTLSVSTDTTVIETDYAKDGNILALRMYHLNKQFYDSWIKNGRIQNAPLIPLNIDKHGEWLYYDEHGGLIKKEVYEHGVLKQTIDFSNFRNGKIKKDKRNK